MGRVVGNFMYVQPTVCNQVMSIGIVFILTILLPVKRDFLI